MTTSILQGADLSTYASVEDVFDAIPPATLSALVADDGNLKVAAGNPALIRCRKNAHAEVTSNLAPIYGNEGMPDELPGNVSEMLKATELAYLKFFLYDRKPELAAKISETYLKDLWKFAQDRMDRLKAAVQEIAPSDNPPPEKPANVGGASVDRGPRLQGDDRDGKRYNFGDY